MVKISYSSWNLPGKTKPYPDFEDAIKAKDFFSNPSLAKFDQKERGDVDKALAEPDLNVVTGSFRLPGIF